MRAGDSGSAFGIAPSEANALATALAISPPTGMIAPSPAPLTPSGLLGEGWFASEAGPTQTDPIAHIPRDGDTRVAISQPMPLSRRALAISMATDKHE